MLLGVNIDHVATLRQARKEDEPNLLDAAKDALKGGADGITVHLREDRRHIQDQDVIALRQFVPRLNLEMAATPAMVDFALKIKPQYCCLVPEKREELTTEGGLNVIELEQKLAPAIQQLTCAGIAVSIFIAPEMDQIKKAHAIGAPYIEIHTGHYANVAGDAQVLELDRIKQVTHQAVQLGLHVNAGHGLKYHNVQPIAKISELLELNIGHSIISRAIFVGLEQAVREMKNLIRRG